MFTRGPEDVMGNKRTATRVDLEVCPKCKERSLHVREMRGEDDHGQIEGGIEACEKCGYERDWVGRC